MAVGISYDNNIEYYDFRVFYALSILISKEGFDAKTPVFAIVILWNLAPFLWAIISSTIMSFGVMSLRVLCFGRLENSDVISKYFDYFVF